MDHVTIMVLKVDLRSSENYKKVKTVLNSFDEIQEQPVYNEGENTVTIKVVGCDPEIMKEKILHKGAGVIQGIRMVVRKEGAPPPPPPPPPPALGVPVPCVPFVPCLPAYPVLVADTCFRRTCCQECHEGCCGGPRFRTCYQECYRGRSGGPCFHGHNYNFGGPPPRYDDGYNSNGGKPVLNYDSYGGERCNDFHPSQEYCSEPASGCQLM